MTIPGPSQGTLDQRDLPIGTVTFLRTDVEGSMATMRALGHRWDEVNRRHLDIVRGTVLRHEGTVVRTEGDAVFAAFGEAGAAAAAAADVQRSIATEPWPDDMALRIRIGLHTGEAHLAGDDYGGFDVNRAARVASVGHGGQVILSETTTALVADALPAGVTLRDLGRHVLRDVPRAERLAQLDIAGLPTDFPPLRTSGSGRGNLPDRLTSFIGRGDELDDLERLAGTARLITLTGPGGIGKSSLAVELARRLAPGHRDGAWFVGLDALDDPDTVGTAVARALGLFDGIERRAADALPGFVADRAMILVLDNFEHLLAAAPLVGTLLHASPSSRVIVTSRAPLHLTGEHEVPVRPLGLGDLADGARRLFVDRAAAVRTGFDPGAELETVDAICALLDGLPLGIELAAARAGMLPLTVIRDRLTANLPLPGTGRRDAPGRQRTLDAAVAWSHDLLDPEAQALLHDLAVFDGSFDVEQVETVARTPAADRPGETLDRLLELVDQSLLVADLDAAPGIRFRMLQTIQAFALGRLQHEGQESETRRRHAAAFLELARTVAARLTTIDQASAIERLSIDDPNLRTAVRWVIQAGNVELAQGLVAALWRYWQVSGQLAEFGELAGIAAEMEGGKDPTALRMWALAAAGNIAYWRADSREAQRRYLQEQQVARIIGDEVGVADAVFNLGHVAFIDGADPATLLTYVDEAVRRFGDLGDSRSVARAKWAYGTLALQAGRYDESRAALQTSLEQFKANDDLLYQAMTEGTLGWLAFMTDDRASACRWAVLAIEHNHAMRDVGTTTISLHIGVLMAVILGRFEDAARMTGAFDALCERYGVRPPAALGVFITNTLDPFSVARDALTQEAWARAYAEGSRLSLDDSVAVVIDLGDTAAASSFA
jgi:predicted ATPase/class 3 adenylate cyclase